jgi:nitrate/nitrite transporter NarK
VVTTADHFTALISVLAIGALIVWFDLRCLADLRQTSDWRLRYFNRDTWALIIIFAFPFGPFLYLAYAKQ